MNGFKKCPNGHYFPEEFAACPYCNGTVSPDAATQQYTQVADDGKTKVMEGFGTPPPTGDTTIIVGFPPKGGGNKPEAHRTRSKLVGWIVSFTLGDKMGTDFRLYEGKNSIGRGPKCNICIADDGAVSELHATIHYLDGDFVIYDERASNGTFVNDLRLKFGAQTELHDGDIIKMGETEFLFRTAGKQ